MSLCLSLKHTDKLSIYRRGLHGCRMKIDSVYFLLLILHVSGEHVCIQVRPQEPPASVFGIHKIEVSSNPIINKIHKSTCIDEHTMTLPLNYSGNIMNFMTMAISLKACNNTCQRFVCGNMSAITNPCKCANMIALAITLDITECGVNWTCSDTPSDVREIHCSFQHSLAHEHCPLSNHQPSCGIDQSQTTHIHDLCFLTNQVCVFVVTYVRVIATGVALVLFEIFVLIVTYLLRISHQHAQDHVEKKHEAEFLLQKL